MAIAHPRLKLYYFAYLATLGAFSPYFGPFLQARGFDAWQLSVLMSLWYGTRALAPNLWDIGVARSSAPIRWLRHGALGALLATLCFLPHWPFWGMVLVMLVFASLYNALMPQYEALTLAHLRRDPESYSSIRLYGSIGFLLVVLGYGALFREIGAGYLIVAMLPLVALLVWASYLSDYPSGERDRIDLAQSQNPISQNTATSLDVSSSRQPSTTLSRVLQPAIIALLFVGFCNQIAHGPLYVYFSIFLLRHGFDEFQVGALWSLGVACEIIAFTLMRRVLLQVPTRTLVAFCLIAGAARWAATGMWPDSGWVIALAQMAHALTFAALHAAFMQIIAQNVSARDLGFTQALLYSVASGLGGVASALIAGLLWETMGDQACFYAAAGFSLLALLAVPWLGSNSHARKPDRNPTLPARPAIAPR
jgi:PPP family 3-phenylpropionic acid transporter